MQPSRRSALTLIELLVVIAIISVLTELCPAVSVTAKEPAMRPEPRVSFNRDIRPILSEYCFSCHGPDAGSRKAGLRLDLKASAMSTLKSGAIAVVPGDPEASDLCNRISPDEAEADRMPPPGSGKGLTLAQVETLRRWVAQGAAWEEHWSLIPARRPPVPEVSDQLWARNVVDRFVLYGIEARSTKPSVEADKTTLIRRLTHDLTGLPPTPAEVDAFTTDTRSNAYEVLVDRLLASPHYGERMAVFWLDLVRYADTVGYHSDVNRPVTVYRDYVIKAFNEDLPFDRFTVEQLAGDLLPNPTTWQKVASAYNMLGLSTEEGGAQAKEYIAKYAADRVRNLGSVWLGATIGCAECHDHKYDPYSTRDFYALEAFFADLQQPGVGTPKPTLFLPTTAQSAERERLRSRLAELSASSPSDPAGKAMHGARTKAIQAEAVKLDQSIRSEIISISGTPRVTRVLHRGDWMDNSGEIVTPAVPSSLKPFEISTGSRATRLDLARWLIAADHPRTARVMVNRLWNICFGSGLADTLDDLGAQGDWPTHPELLDWLAVEFRESGWSVKHVLRLLTLSAAYRQSSRPRDDLASIDPTNRLVARQASYRREAEFVRDHALAVSGLLTRAISGESVRPYQPQSYWRFLNFPKREYTASRGADQYRRGLYVHWQRTLLHPALLALDAPSREQCSVRRPVSNTPQVALALLNDPSLVEAARSLAGRALREGGADEARRLTWLWRCVLSRPPSAEELDVLATLLEKHRRQYAAEPGVARSLLGVGQAVMDYNFDPTALAAWTSVARAVLNLDETITRD